MMMIETKGPVVGLTDAWFDPHEARNTGSFRLLLCMLDMDTN